MFCGLGEEKRTKISKKKKEKKGKKRKKKEKKEKKEINLIAAKSGLVGMKGYFETYNIIIIIIIISHVGSDIFPVDGVGRILYGHCLYYSSPFHIQHKIQPYEIFFAVLKSLLTETAFYAKLAGRFSGSKTKFT